MTFPPVMVVDDDEDILLMARRILERRGFEVVTRTSAPEWEELQRVQPCVLFMDINLGCESGMVACRAIKQHKRFFAIPVILISGMEGDRLASAAQECHADGFLSKPYSGDLLTSIATHYARGASGSLN